MSTTTLILISTNSPEAIIPVLTRGGINYTVTDGILTCSVTPAQMQRLLTFSASNQIQTNILTGAMLNTILGL